jgi:hypothetical protein
MAHVRDAGALEEMGLKDFDAVVVAIGQALSGPYPCRHEYRRPRSYDRQFAGGRNEECCALFPQ